MDFQKKQMEEAAILYYEKKYTQHQIAQRMNLSRQTVSKLLNDAIRENIVEIKIHHPEIVCAELEQEICRKFNVQNAIVCGVSTDDDALCRLMTVKKAVSYVKTLVEQGGQKIAVSWGRTIQMFIREFSKIQTVGNVVFPLFGATEQEEDYFLSNELARMFAEAINAKVTYAWFPYKPDHVEDCELFKKTSYYKKLHDLWSDIDLAIVGIGNDKIIQTFGEVFGQSEKCKSAIGDISTHFFDQDGVFLDLYENTLCASKENLKNAKHTIAIVSGQDKTEAILGALQTGMIDTLVCDEYTASRVLASAGREPR